MRIPTDLMTFKNKISPTRDTASGTHFFELNGRADFGSAYQGPTVNMNAINNGQMCVFDLEVYSIKGIYFKIGFFFLQKAYIYHRNTLRQCSVQLKGP